jgi:hypothetical protein
MDLASFGLTAELPNRFGHAAFYQQFVRSLIYATRGKSASRELGLRLVALAEYSNDLRDAEIVRSISQLLLTPPFVEGFESVGHYCGALAADREGDFLRARSCIAKVFDRLPPALRSKALLTLSSGYGQSGDLCGFLSAEP